MSCCLRLPTTVTLLRIRPIPNHKALAALVPAVLLPGYCAAAMDGSRVVTAQQCPYKFYCPGGTPQGAFDPASPGARPPTETTVVPCPDGLWTQTPGAVGVDACGEWARGLGKASASAHGWLAAGLILRGVARVSAGIAASGQRSHGPLSCAIAAQHALAVYYVSNSPLCPLCGTHIN
jgi:hypothetical protein